jgi:hypothetical protein
LTGFIVPIKPRVTASYSEAAGLLPSVSHTVDALVAEGPANGRRDAFRLQASIAVAAAKLATRAADALAGRLAAERAHDAAEAAEDPFGRAASAYQLICALLRTGGQEDRDNAEQIAVSCAEDIRGADPNSLTWRGALGHHVPAGVPCSDDASLVRLGTAA